MSALSITAANVVPGTDADIAHGIAGETITAGQPVYRSSTDGKWYKADSNSGTAEARVPLGIALCGSSASQPVSVQKSGTITIAAIKLGEHRREHEWYHRNNNAGCYRIHCYIYRCSE